MILLVMGPSVFLKNNSSNRNCQTNIFNKLEVKNNNYNVHYQQIHKTINNFFKDKNAKKLEELRLNLKDAISTNENGIRSINDKLLNKNI